MVQYMKTLIAASLAILSLPCLGLSAGAENAQPTRYMIVATGAELLTGVYADGHTYFLTRTLGPLGLRCVGSMSVDDKHADIDEALRFATGKASLVIVTGGLGPTDSDITREALSRFTAIPLREHPEVLKQMAKRFGVPPAQLRSNLRRQAQAPESGTYFKNANGTAVGLAFEKAGTTIIALPGPPHELQTMVRNELVPYLNRRFGTRLPGCSITLRFVGLGESQIDQTLKDHVHPAAEITTSSQFEAGCVDFTFSLPDDTPQNRARLEELKQNITKHLGDYVYSVDETSLAEHVVKLLDARGWKLALAEVGSGGSLAAALSAADGARNVFAGGYTAPTAEILRKMLAVRDDQWTSGTSGSQKTEQLASAAAAATASQWAIAVGQSRRDEKGDTYVDVAFKQPSGRPQSRRMRFRGSGELARARLNTQLLDQLRRKLK